jgi:ankyrin repeat protein
MYSYDLKLVRLPVILIIVLMLCLSMQPNTENADGVTALLSAVAAGSLPCLEVLIEVHNLNLMTD